MSGAPPEGGRGPSWFVQAAGRVWGPYSQARLEAFAAEGRVGPATLVGPAAGGPFLPAGRQARLLGLFGEVEPEADEPLQTAAQDAAEPAGAGPRALLIWAELRSQRPERFEQVLAAYGPFVRVGAGLWLLRARMSPAPLRNALTRRLGSGDALMAVEAGAEQAAWFNLDGEADRALRQLWAPAAAKG